MKILISLQNTVFARFLAYKLEAMNHTVRVVQDGKTAMEVLSNDDYALAVLGVTIPFYSGLEILHHFKENKSIDTQFVLLSRVAYAKSQSSALAMGAAAYFVLPIDVKEVLNCINELMKNYHPFVGISSVLETPFAV